MRAELGESRGSTDEPRGEVLYRSELLGLRRDAVRITGKTVDRHVVEYRPACAVVVLDAARERTLLIDHYRHPVRRTLAEIPGGMLQGDESIEMCARREVLEETGYEVGSLTSLLKFHPEPAFADHRIVLLQGIAASAPSREPRSEAEITGPRWVPLVSIRSMIETGEIASSWSVIGLLMTLDAD